MKASLTLAAINAKLEEKQECSFRNHLGASVIGSKCKRQIWYKFRWIFDEQFTGQMLRLFKRGQDEEETFTSYLTSIGCEVWPVDPKTGKQWTVSHCGGHFGGSCDGVARGIPELPNIPFVVEFKTHNDKSFKLLESQGLCKSKPEHFDQAQTYTHGLGLKWCLYMGVNKNTDHIFPELIQVNPKHVESLIAKATAIIYADEPPPKIDPSPGFYMCKGFCRFSHICHGGEAPARNCRTCEHSAPVASGQWFCKKFTHILTKDQQLTGCKVYTMKNCFK